MLESVVVLLSMAGGAVSAAVPESVAPRPVSVLIAASTAPVAGAESQPTTNAAMSARVVSFVLESVIGRDF